MFLGGENPIHHLGPTILSWTVVHLLRVVTVDPVVIKLAVLLLTCPENFVCVMIIIARYPT